MSGQNPTPDDRPARSRRPRILDLIAGLPALIAVAGLAVVSAAAMTHKPSIEDYRREFERRAKSNDLSGALVCLRRVVALDPSDAKANFSRVLILERLGASGEALAIARSLAPNDNAGYAPAHFWLAQRVAADTSNLGRTWPFVERHLNNFIRASEAGKDPASVRAGKAVLGNLYTLINRPRDARPLLEETAGDDPRSLFRLANVYAALNDQDQFNRYNLAAMNSAKSKLGIATEGGKKPEPDPNYDPGDLRAIWAVTTSNLKNYEEAVRLLSEDLGAGPNPALSKTRSEVYLSWARSLESQPDAASQRIGLLEKALNDDPMNALALVELGKIMNGEGQDGEKARATLRAMLTSGDSPAMAHFLLGNDAWKHNQADAARTHWEQAFKRDPKMPAVANNLAFLLAHRDPPDTTRALSLADQGLSAVSGKTDPVSVAVKALLHGTRGQVLVKMQKWSEAVTDLETAMKTDPKNQNTEGVHNALAEAYEQLKLPDLAKEHRELAKKAAKKQNSPAAG